MASATTTVIPDEEGDTGLEVIVGTYESFLLGYKLILDESEGEKVEIGLLDFSFFFTFRYETLIVEVAHFFTGSVLSMTESVVTCAKVNFAVN